MGKLMKGGISYGGVADINIDKENVVLTVEEMPSEPHEGMTVLYESEDSSGYIEGHIYRYSETDTQWIDILSVESIPTDEVNSLFD